MIEKRFLSILLCMTLLISMFSSLPVSVVKAETGPSDPSLKLWYKFDETVGSNVYDSSGNNRDGTLIGTGATWLNGNGLDFNGANSYVKLPDSIMNGVTSVTVSTMVYVNTSLTANYMMFAFGNTTSNNGNGYLYMSGDAFRAGLTTGNWSTEQNAARTSGGNLAKGVWKHVAYTLSGSTAYLYEDGVQVGTKTNVTINPSQIGSGTTTADYIGRSVYTGDKYFKGQMKDFRVYNRALSASEVQALALPIYADIVARDKAALTLGTSTVTGNLTLPTSGVYGSTITWSTSDPGVITNTGVITAGASDQSATLTATIIKGSTSDTKTFNIIVKNSDSATLIFLQNEAAQIGISDANAIRGNITLPLTSAGGAAIAWTSDRPDVINTNVIVNPGYDNTPPGVVTRQAADTQVNLSATLSYNGKNVQKTISVTVKAKPKILTPTDMKAYMFAYFTGESSTGEQTYFATSKDGLNWQDLNDLQPVLTSNVGTQGVRDQYIFRSAEGDKYYIIATDLRIASGAGWGAASTAGSKNLVIWESTDLVNWSSPRLINIGLSDSGFTWAPEAIYDDNTGEYVLYWASNPKKADGTFDTSNIYYVKTRDFSTFTQPTLYIHRSGTKGLIDLDIFKANNSKYPFYRVSASDGQIVIEGSSQLLTNTWDVIGTLQSVGLTNSDVEAPQIYKFNDRDEYTIIADQYATGRGYLPVLTTDLSDPSTYHIPASTQYWFGVNKKRHGEVMSLTQEEYDAIMAKWGDVPVKPNEQQQQNPILQYNFDEGSTDGTIQDASGNNYTGTLNGNATYVNDSDKNSQVLYVDGTSGTFAAFPKGFYDGRDTVSISMDIKPVTVSGNFFTFGIGKSTTKYMFLKTRDTEIRNAITMGSYSFEDAAAGATPSIDNKWMNIKLILTPTTMTIYKDGALLAQNNNVHVPMSYLGKDLLAYLGKSFYSGDAYFKGYFDNVKVYNRALTAAEIADSGSSVTGVSLNKSTAALEVGKTDTLIATITPSSAINKSVTFTSSNAAVVVSNPVYDPQTGTTSVTITGASEGSAIITATTADGGKTGICTVSVSRSTNTAGLKMWYKFDETSGTTAVDSSGNGFNGTYVNTPGWGTGMSNGSFKMSGGSSSTTTAPYVKIPNGVLNGTKSITIASFVKWNSSTTTNQWLYALGVDSNKYMFTTPYNGSKFLYSAIANYTGTNSNYGYTTEQKLPASAALTGDVWKHVALVIDSDNHTGTLYVDGIPVAVNTNMTIMPSDLYDASKDYSGYIGKSFYPGDPYFAGEMDDFRIYDRALSSGEVVDLAGPLVSATSILNVTQPELKYNAIIDRANSKITLALKPGSDIKSIAPAFALPSGATISPASGTPVDFTNPVTYTVTGKDGSTQQWSIKAVIANSPAIPGLYADPNIIVFGNKYYIYPTTDGFASWSGTQFKAFSSDDLVNWTDHGVIFDVPNNTTWATGKAWAPAIIEKNGKYYFYFCGSSQIGVAVSDSPTGPFVDALGHPLIAAGQYSGQMIDPMAFTDDDGQSYLYFGNGNAYVVKLNEDMISLNGTAANITSSAPGFREGAFVIKRNNKYYFMWSENDTRDEDYRVAYAIGDSPMGPFTKQSVILAKDLSLGIKGTGHHSVVKVPGKDEYYIVYHRFAIPGGDGTHREVAIDKMEFNTDGTIKNVIPTLEGITTPVMIQNIPPAAPNVTLNDATNIVTGLTAAMEYKLDSAGYVMYNPTTFAALDLSGSHTLLVRIAANAATGVPAGDVTTLSFTSNAIVSSDLNGDGKVGIGDIGIMAARYGKNFTDPNWNSYKNADMNNDGVIDIADLAAVASLMLN